MRILDYVMELSNSKSNDEDKTEDTERLCYICHRQAQNPSYVDSCMHLFCFQCIKDWSQRTNRCPTCRTPYKNILTNITPEGTHDKIAVSHGVFKRVFNFFGKMLSPARTTSLEERRTALNPTDSESYHSIDEVRRRYERSASRSESVDEDDDLELTMIPGQVPYDEPDIFPDRVSLEGPDEGNPVAMSTPVIEVDEEKSRQIKTSKE